MRTILIVDDEDRIRKILGQILRKKGFRVIKADNAMNAYQLLKEGKNVDLVLLDINLPQVPGDMLYEVMQMFFRNNKVIVCSVLPVEEQSRRIPNAVDYYDKSENFSILMQKVEMVFKSEMLFKKILIVDDDPRIRLLYRRLLMKAGYYPVDSGDHPETFRFLKKQIESIDLVILDIAMPRISGLEFFDMIKKECPETKVIISSVFSEDQQRFFIFNADDYFDKSEGHKVLLDKIKRLITNN